MNPYIDFVSGFSQLVQKGKSFPLGGFPPAKLPPVANGAPKALFFAPHPDDETIIGGLAFRLRRDAHWQVVNVAVTQGSKKERQAERLTELKGACHYLGFDLVQTAENGLEKVTVTTRSKDGALWASMVKTIGTILQQHRPKVIFFPHEHDWNGTHIGVHFLIMDALKSLGSTFECFLVETEFWGQMQTPNLMVEYSETEVADLITATSFHVGEVKRNPYHLLIPAWMQDNVRRGAELVGGQGQAAPDFRFAQLYRLTKWAQGQVQPLYTGGRCLPMSTNAATLFSSPA